MENLFKNKLFWLCIGLLMFNMFVFVVGKVVIDKVADEVIERLESEYSPSPYGPGFDPDKVEVLRDQKPYYELKKALSSDDLITETIEWNDNWERDRGFIQSR